MRLDLEANGRAESRGDCIAPFLRGEADCAAKQDGGGGKPEVLPNRQAETDAE